MFPLTSDSTYEPQREESFGALAKESNQTPESVMYDYLVEVRIVPQSNCYKVEVVYEVKPVRSDKLPEINPVWIVGIDLGVNKLMEQQNHTVRLYTK